MDSGVFGDQGIRYALNGTGAELFKVDPITGTITVAECPQHQHTRKRRQLEFHHIKKVNITHPSEYGILHFDTEVTSDSSTEMNDYVTYHHAVDNDDELHNYEDDETVHKNNLGKYPCLDYETQTDYYLNYQATDNEGKGQMSVTSLRISVLDSNDSPPKCESSMYRATLDEGAMTFDGSGLTIKARDEDTVSEINYE
jgi:hypothetical protein